MSIHEVRDKDDSTYWSVTNGLVEARFSASTGVLTGLKAGDAWLIEDGTAELCKPSFWTGGSGTPGDHWFSTEEREPAVIARPLADGTGRQLALYGHRIWRHVQVRPDQMRLLFSFHIPRRHHGLVEFELAIESRLPEGWSVVIPVNGRPKVCTSDSRESTSIANPKLTKRASEKSRETFLEEEQELGAFPTSVSLYSAAKKAAIVFRFESQAVLGLNLTWEEKGALLQLVCPRARLRPGESFSFPLIVDIRDGIAPDEVPGLLAAGTQAADLSLKPIQPAEQDVLYSPDELPDILSLLQGSDCDVLCEDPDYELQGDAVKLGRRFGLSVSCQRYTYGSTEHITWPMAYREKPICVVGPPGINAAATLVDRMAFTCNEEFPGKGRGVIKLFRKLPMSPHPVVVVSGSDREGTRKALEFLIDRAGDYRPPDFGDFYAYAEDPMLWTHSYSVTKQEGKLEKMTLSGAKGERAIGRLVLRAERSVTGLKIVTTALSFVDGAGTIPWPRMLELRNRNDLDDGAFILDPRIRPGVPARFTRGYWLELDIPRAAAPGIYRGEIKVLSKESGARTLPVELRVWDFEIPERSPIAVTMWNLFPKEDPGPRIFEPEPSKVDDDPAFCALLDNLRAHEVNVDSSFHPMQYCRWVENEDGEIEFDYRTFDRYMEFTERKGFDRGTMLYYVWHGRAGKVDPDRFVCLKYSPDRMAYFGRDGEQKRFDSKFAWAKVAQRYNQDFIEHLKARGWYDRCFVVIGDEPGDYPRWRNEVLPFHRMGIKFTTAMGHSSFGGEKHVDDVHQHWIVHQWHARGPEPRPFVKRRFEQGDTLWWYECKGDHLISHDLAPMRSFAFDLWREQVQGFGRYWYGGPLICQEEEPRIRNSISWELFRKGIEDYKTLWVLDSRIRMAEALGDTETATGARTRMNELLTSLPNTYQLESNSLRLDFAGVRQRLAQMVLALKDYAWNPAFYSWNQRGEPNWGQAVRALRDFVAKCSAEDRQRALALVRNLYGLALERRSGEIPDHAVKLLPYVRALAGGGSELDCVSDYLSELGFEAAGLRLEVVASLPTESATSKPRAIQGPWHGLRLRVTNTGDAPLDSVAALLDPAKGVALEPAAEIQLGDVPAGGKKEENLKIRFTDQFRDSSYAIRPTLRYTRKGLTNAHRPAGLTVAVQLDAAVEDASLSGRSFRPLSLGERRFVNNVFPVDFSFRLRNSTDRKLDLSLRPKVPDGWACKPEEVSVALAARQAKDAQFALELASDMDPPRGEGQLRLGISYGDVAAAQSFTLPYQRLQEWSLIGPFQVMPGLSTDFISYPTKPVSLSQPYARRSGKAVEWQTVPMEGKLDFAYFFGEYADERLGPLVGPNFAAAFAHSYFHSPRQQRAKLEVVSENRCTVWVNRRLAFPTGKGAEKETGADGLMAGGEEADEELEMELEDDDEGGILLRKGWNEICVKCRKETEKSWQAKLIFKPAKENDRDFVPPELFTSRLHDQVPAD